MDNLNLCFGRLPHSLNKCLMALYYVFRVLLQPFWILVSPEYMIIYESVAFLEALPMIMAMQGFVSSATSPLNRRRVVFEGWFARWASGDRRVPDTFTKKCLLIEWECAAHKSTSILANFENASSKSSMVFGSSKSFELEALNLKIY